MPNNQQRGALCSLLINSLGLCVHEWLEGSEAVKKPSKDRSKFHLFGVITRQTKLKFFIYFLSPDYRFVSLQLPYNNEE